MENNQNQQTLAPLATQVHMYSNSSSTKFRWDNKSESNYHSNTLSTDSTFQNQIYSRTVDDFTHPVNSLIKTDQNLEFRNYRKSETMCWTNST